MNKYCKKYLSQIKHSFPSRGRRVRQYIALIAESVENYCSDNEPDSMDMLYERFGKPDSFVKEYYNNLDNEALSGSISLGLCKKRCSIIILIAILLCLLSYITINMHSRYFLNMENVIMNQDSDYNMDNNADNNADNNDNINLDKNMN